MNIGAVILAGGNSRRMGRDKAGLTLNGVRFLDKLAYELSGFTELLVSVDEKGRYPGLPYPLVCDVFLDSGPLGGLHAALRACASDALVAVPCDVPLFSKSLADGMCAYLGTEDDAVVALSEDGREHPLCGVYKKSCLDVLEQCLEEGNYRMRDVLARLKVRAYPAGSQSWRLQNVNTPDAYEKLEMRSCLAVCGWKNAGKTTLIERLLPLLSAYGLDVAVIKHDGHRYEADVPGTDSFRFFQAGAGASFVYDGEKFSCTKRGRVSETELFQMVPEADLILLEGHKESSYPKIEILRKENGRPPIERLAGRIAYVSDIKLEQGLPVFGLADVKGLASFLYSAYENGDLKERWQNEEHVYD